MDGPVPGAGAQVDSPAEGGAQGASLGAGGCRADPDIAAFEAALRAYFDAAIQICGLPATLPFPPPDEDVTLSATLMRERSQNRGRRRRSWTTR
jgi:hypothetical protein